MPRRGAGMTAMRHSKHRAAARRMAHFNRNRFNCSRCGEKTRHSHYFPASWHSGDFWICPNLYSTDGRRLDTQGNWGDWGRLVEEMAAAEHAGVAA